MVGNERDLILKRKRKKEESGLHDTKSFYFFALCVFGRSIQNSLAQNIDL